MLADPAALARARAEGALVALPPDAAARGLRADGPFHLRPDALALALYIAAAVRAIGQTAAPLELTAATTDAADLAPPPVPPTASPTVTGCTPPATPSTSRGPTRARRRRWRSSSSSTA